jgi:hypothetical protein
VEEVEEQERIICCYKKKKGRRAREISRADICSIDRIRVRDREGGRKREAAQSTAPPPLQHRWIFFFFFLFESSMLALVFSFKYCCCRCCVPSGLFFREGWQMIRGRQNRREEKLSLGKKRGGGGLCTT